MAKAETKEGMKHTNKFPSIRLLEVFGCVFMSSQVEWGDGKIAASHAQGTAAGSRECGAKV
jgi:hypothetical protein